MKSSYRRSNALKKSKSNAKKMNIIDSKSKDDKKRQLKELERNMIGPTRL